MRDPEVIATGAQLTIAIVTGETLAFPDMQHFLAPRFKAELAQHEKQIQPAVDDPNIRAILLDLKKSARSAMMWCWWPSPVLTAAAFL